MCQLNYQSVRPRQTHMSKQRVGKGRLDWVVGGYEWVGGEVQSVDRARRLGWAAAGWEREWSDSFNHCINGCVTVVG